MSRGPLRLTFDLLHAQYVILMSSAMLAQQQTRHWVNCLILTETYCSLIHFDRGGVQCTDPLDIHADPVTFLRLILGVMSVNEEDLGFDTSFSWGRDNRGLKCSGTTTLTGKSEIASYALDLRYPSWRETSIVGQGVTSRNVWKLVGPMACFEKMYCIKESWHHHEEGTRPEHEILKQVVGVPGVVQMAFYSYERHKSYSFRGGPLLPGSVTLPHISFSRIVLEAYRGPVSMFTTEKDVIGAFRDAIHGALFYSAAYYVSGH